MQMNIFYPDSNDEFHVGTNFPTNTNLSIDANYDFSIGVQEDKYLIYYIDISGNNLILQTGDTKALQAGSTLILSGWDKTTGGNVVYRDSGNNLFEPNTPPEINGTYLISVVDASNNTLTINISDFQNPDNVAKIEPRGGQSTKGNDIPYILDVPSTETLSIQEKGHITVTGQLDAHGKLEVKNSGNIDVEGELNVNGNDSLASTIEALMKLMLNQEEQ